MSVLVKGMKMPEWCEECRFYDAPHCAALGIDIEDWGRAHTFPHICCPLVGVPTHHGRLIDGDALYENAVKRTEKKGNYYNVMQYVISPFMVKLAPTIIEAED